MDPATRRERLIADLQSLEALKASSSVFDFQSEGDPPDRYALTFRGAGLYREAGSGRILPVDEHRCDLRLTFSYPRRPPEIRWLTPLLHPNIAFGGFIRMEDVGLPADEDIGLDVLCERLWDVARLAYYDLEQATHFAARQWVESQQDRTLPIDPRPLRDRLIRSHANVIRYRHRDGRPVFRPESAGEDGVLYIGEDTPLPPLPTRRAPPDDAEDIFYIGD
jgi:hypothetical protein